MADYEQRFYDVLAELESAKGYIAELEAEVEHLKVSRDNFAIHAENILQQLAASQASEVQLREAFQAYVDAHEECTDADDWMAMTCSMEAHHVTDEALAVQKDTFALEVLITTASEITRDNIANIIAKQRNDVPATGAEFSEAIRNLNLVTLEDIVK